MKPLFSNNIQSSSCATLLHNDVEESDEGKVAEIMNDYFVNITEALGISCSNTEDYISDLKEYQCSEIIQYFEPHSSILKIQRSIRSITKFYLGKLRSKR